MGDYEMIRDAETDREFVLAWQGARTVQEVADMLGVEPALVRRWEWEIRAAGVRLKWIARDANGGG